MKLLRFGDEDGKTLNVTMSNPYTIIYENFAKPTPLLIWIVSIIAGALLLALLSYALYKCGFFKRAQKEEMSRITRASMKISPEQLFDMTSN